MKRPLLDQNHNHQYQHILFNNTTDSNDSSESNNNLSISLDSIDSFPSFECLPIIDLPELECFEQVSSKKIKYDSNHEHEILVENYSTDEEEQNSSYEIDDIEKQIISKSLAMILRSNSSDLLYIDDKCLLNLVEYVIIFPNNTYEVFVKVEVDCDLTKVNINYRKSTQFFSKNIDLQWDTPDISDEIIILKNIPYLLLWRQNIKIILEPKFDKNDNWCYFRQVRQHLSNIDNRFD